MEKEYYIIKIIKEYMMENLHLINMMDLESFFLKMGIIIVVNFIMENIKINQ